MMKSVVFSYLFLTKYFLRTSKKNPGQKASGKNLKRKGWNLDWFETLIENWNGMANFAAGSKEMKPFDWM